MCQQIVQFCSGSTKPLLIAGSVLSLLLAIAIGYNGCTTNALYTDIDPDIAQSKSLSYYLQLAATAYLTLVTLLAIYAAQYDEKHSIRALAVITSVNFILALAAIAMVPTGAEVKQLFQDTLTSAAKEYDFSDKWPMNRTVDQSMINSIGQKLAAITAADQAQVMNSSVAPPPVAAASTQPRNTRATDASPSSEQQQQPPPPKQPRQMNKETATKIWDSLQSRGCCGLNNGTDTWPTSIPKSCCANATTEGNEQKCKEIDQQHQQGCLALISSTSMNLMVVLALIALVNFYLAAITGLSAYRTFHYNEASQSAYS